MDLSSAKYQLRADFVHVEDGDGVTIHKHATGVKLKDFFNTEGFELSETCLKLDSGNHCAAGEKKLQMMKNGEKIIPTADFELMDGDKYLIAFGTETDVELQSEYGQIYIHANVD